MNRHHKYEPRQDMSGKISSSALAYASEVYSEQTNNFDKIAVVGEYVYPLSPTDERFKFDADYNGDYRNVVDFGVKPMIGDISNLSDQQIEEFTDLYLVQRIIRIRQWLERGSNVFVVTHKRPNSYSYYQDCTSILAGSLERLGGRSRVIMLEDCNTISRSGTNKIIGIVENQFW